MSFTRPTFKPRYRRTSSMRRGLRILVHGLLSGIGMYWLPDTHPGWIRMLLSFAVAFFIASFAVSIIAFALWEEWTE